MSKDNDDASLPVGEREQAPRRPPTADDRPPQAPAQASERSKRRSKDDLGSRRGVETFFRNAYRAHLDLIALAATKANIMISINGLILSLLFISEAFVMAAEPLLEIPTAMFLLACFVSMAFAMLSAVPARRKGEWTAEDFDGDRANVLVFEDYTALSEEEFVPAVLATLRDSTRTYESMIRQLYFLGSHANHRLKLLTLSYWVFVIGLGLSLLTSFVLLLTIYLRDAELVIPDQPDAAAPVAFQGFREFRETEGLFEVSGAVQLPDGRLAVVEDGGTRPVRFVSLDAMGDAHVAPPSRDAPLRGRAGLRSLGELKDLEAMAVSRRGTVYAITSHSRTKTGGRTTAAREKLVRFRIDGDHVTDAALVSDLKRHLTERFPDLEQSNGSAGAGINVEGLALNREQDKLLLGFRSPLEGGKAIVTVVENPAEVFDSGAPRFTRLLLDLDGSGIRGLAYDRRLNGYLVLARREGDKRASSELWFWSGHETDPARRLEIEGVRSLRRAEAITPIRWNDREAVAIFSDDGDPRTGQAGRYILLTYDQLAIDTPSNPRGHGSRFDPR